MDRSSSNESEGSAPQEVEPPQAVAEHPPTAQLEIPHLAGPAEPTLDGEDVSRGGGRLEAAGSYGASDAGDGRDEGGREPDDDRPSGFDEPPGPPGGGDAVEAAEVARLEALLRSRSQRVVALERTLSRNKRLLLALDSQLAALDPAAAVRPGQPGPDAGAAAPLAALSEAEAARDEALGRAVEAEAALAEVAFRLDEALGHLAVARQQQSQVPAEGTDAGLEHSEMQGRIRGLRAALAETEEARDMAQARLLLMEHERDDLRSELHDRDRLLSEREEALELALLRARSQPSQDRREGRDSVSQADAASSRMRGELQGLKARLEESERALSAANRLRGELAQQLTTREAGEQDLQAELATAQLKAEAVGHQLETLAGSDSEERTALEARVVAAEANAVALEARAEAAEARAAALDARGREAEERATGMDARAAEAEAKAAEAEAKASEAQAKASEAEARANGLATRVASLEEALQQADSTVQEREADAARQKAVEAHSDTLRDALHEVRGTLDGLASALAQALGDSATLTSGEPMQSVPGTLESPAGSTDAPEQPQSAAALQELEAQLEAVREAHSTSLAQRKMEAEAARSQRDELLDALDRHERRRRALEVALRGMLGLIPAGDPLAAKLGEAIEIATTR